MARMPLATVTDPVKVFSVGKISIPVSALESPLTVRLYGPPLLGLVMAGTVGATPVTPAMLRLMPTSTSMSTLLPNGVGLPKITSPAQMLLPLPPSRAPRAPP